MTSQSRTQVYMTMAHLGTVAAVTVLAARLLDLPDAVRIAANVLLFVTLVMLLRRKLRDEYVESLWASGTSFAFVALVTLFLFLPFGEGFIDGLLRLDHREDTAIRHAPALAILCFFIGFQWKRWRIG